MKFLMALSFLFCSLASHAQKLPLLELGIGAAVVSAPHYPGSDQSQTIPLAVPIFFYRGDVYRNDREGGNRLKIFSNENLKMDLSFGGSFPANSKDNDARAGMEDLDWTGEIGPRISYFQKVFDGRGLIRYALPIRLVFRTDFAYTQRLGSKINPGVSLQLNSCFNYESLRCFFSFDFTFVSGGISNYFYSVTPKDVTANRLAYNGKSGYLGSSLFTGIAKRFKKNVALFVGGGANFYQGNPNVDSSLFRDKINYSVFTGLTWFFWQSEAREISKLK